MDFSQTTVWLIAALVLGGAEMFVGSFYLLVLGLGCLGAACASLCGLGLGWQCSAFAVLVVIGAFIVLRMRAKDKAEDKEQNLDVGQKVTVVAWGLDGVARVNYRGAVWDAVCAEDDSDSRQPGVFVIESVRGSRLVLRPEAKQ